jgi:hypothetical protein
MTTPTMSEVERSKGSSRTGQTPWSSVEVLDASEIKSIQTAHGWENVSNCQKKFFSVTSSDPTGLYSYLKYTNQNGQTCYTPFQNIIALSPEEFSGSSSGSSSAR